MGIPVGHPGDLAENEWLAGSSCYEGPEDHQEWWDTEEDPGWYLKTTGTGRGRPVRYQATPTPPLGWEENSDGEDFPPTDGEEAWFDGEPGYAQEYWVCPVSEDEMQGLEGTPHRYHACQRLLATGLLSPLCCQKFWPRMYPQPKCFWKGSQVSPPCLSLS